MPTTTLNKHINFRIPQVSREFLEQYAKLHNISLSWLLRLAINRIIDDINTNTIPVDLSREQMRVRVQVLKHEAKRLRVDAYEKMNAIAWFKKQEEYKELRRQGKTKQHLAVEYRVIMNMSDAHFTRYGNIQQEIIALSNDIEDSYDKHQKETKGNR